MNNFVIPIEHPTPQKRRRRSLVCMPSKTKHSNYSLQLPDHTNPPQIKVLGALSQRSYKPQQLHFITNKHPLTSRKKSLKDGERKQREKLPSIFLVRHKNNNHFRERTYINAGVDQQLKTRRDFDSYLNYIMSNSEKYFSQKTRNPQLWDSNIKTAKNIQYIFLKLCSSFQNSTKNSKDICLTYLSLDQKSESENFISFHTNQPSIHKLFILQRLICYYIIILEGSIKSNIYLPLFTKCSYYFYTYFHTIGENIKAKGKKQGIGSTVKNLKLACQVQKGCEQIILELKQLTKPLSRQLFEAEKQLLLLIYYINEPNFIDKLYRLQCHLNWKLFKLCPVPYLPVAVKNYTLVLEIDMTIIYYDQTKELLMFRPYLQLFLEMMKPRFQIVLFTTASKQYADKIVQQIDPMNKYFEVRLYNTHLSLKQGKLYKDLSKLGRNLSKVVVIDSEISNYRDHLQNVIKLSSWDGNNYDEELKIVCQTIKDLADHEVDDFRKHLMSSKISRKRLTHIIEQAEQTNITKF